MSPSFSNKSLTSRRCLPEVLCGISSRFQLLSPTEGQVAHALLTRSPLSHPSFLTEISKVGASFDLHVLGMPPAFILSQDQTLNKLYLSWLSQLKPIHRNFNLFQNKSQKWNWTLFPERTGVPFRFFSSSLFLVLKAFKLFLHCLIFKVHRGALPGLAVQRLCYFTTFGFACQELFSNSFWSVRLKLSALTSGATLYHIQFSLSRTFFAGFFKDRPLCSCLSLFPAVPHATAWLIYYFVPGKSSIFYGFFELFWCFFPTH